MTDESAAGPARPEAIAAADLPARVATGEPLLVLFRVEGCGACAAMEPVLSGVARSVEVPVVTVNPRDHPSLIETHRITSTPTLALFADGTEVDRLAAGFVPAEDVIAFVEAGLDASTGADTREGSPERNVQG